MVYAKFNPNFAIASSNIKDIQAYCTEKKIQFVTTMDILIMANKSGLISVEECNTFIKTVNQNEVDYRWIQCKNLLRDFQLDKLK